MNIKLENETNETQVKLAAYHHLACAHADLNQAKKFIDKAAQLPLEASTTARLNKLVNMVEYGLLEVRELLRKVK